MKKASSTIPLSRFTLRAGVRTLAFSPDSGIRTPQLNDLGIPVRGINWVRLHPGRTLDGRPSLLASMGQNNGGLFVLDIDLASGRCRQFSVNTPGADYPSASLRSQRTGMLYVGSAWTGHLHRYDPAQPELGLVDLGAIDPEWATFPNGIQEAPDGGIWIGAYPGACLTRFDPETRTFRRFGRMDETDKYLFPLCGDDGTIVAQVKMIRFRLAALDPQSGRHTTVGPVLETPTDHTRRYRFFKGVDGLLYLDSDQGKFLLRGMSALPVERVPDPMAGVPAVYQHGYQLPVIMPGGMTAEFTDEASNVFRHVRLTSSSGAKPTRDLALDWAGGGTQLFLIHHGPDGRIYGSSYMPEHLFRCDVDGAGLTDLGQCSVSAGDAHSMLNFGNGMMAIASYPAARISLYDPQRPYHFGTTPGSNPHDIGSLDEGEVAYRPHTMAWVPGTATMEGRIWVGSVPNAGLRNGTLAWYEPATGRRGTHREVVPDASPNCMQWLPEADQLLIGLGTEPGSGVQVQRSTGAFALWDVRADRLAHRGDFGASDLADVGSFAPAGHGRFFVLTGRPAYLATDYGATPAPTRILLIDPIQRKILKQADVPTDLLGGLTMFSFDALRAHESGAIFLVLAGGVCRIDPDSCVAEVVWKIPSEEITVAGPLVGRRLFFATRWKLRCVDLPAELFEV